MHKAQKAKTLGELRSSEYSEARLKSRTVRDEIRENLIRKLESGEDLLPGIVGYAESVEPQLVNALLARHHFILLGLRGQAKSRIIRELVRFLDDEMPVLDGVEIHENPYAPITRAGRMLLEAKGDAAPIRWVRREDRFVEKLATPDVTIADVLGDVDPIRAARSGLDLSDELTIHYGLLPRAHRGIFAINELPDLAGKIQVGLFNILQEGDVQIKGYPVRLPLDVLMVFTANPEDYTARGKIITPLKDRIGAEIRTHYPPTLEQGVAITRQEAWTARHANGRVVVPYYLREIVEDIAFQARRDRRVDKRSGVSQRLPISLLETVVSNAERRALKHHEGKIVPRVSDVHASLTAITGKLELEYEGEMKGAETVAKELVRTAVAQAFQKYCGSADLRQVVEWFELGGFLKLPDTSSAAEILASVTKIQGLLERAKLVNDAKDQEMVVAAAEFVLEGLAATRRITRSEERGFHRSEERRPEVGYEDVDSTAKGRLN